MKPPSALLSILIGLTLAAVTPPLPIIKVRQKKILHGATTLMRLAQTRAVTQPKPRLTPDFIYPNGATNYLWDLQQSFDLKHWTTLSKNMSYPPSTNYTYFVGNSGQIIGFYRMMGHKNYE